MNAVLLDKVAGSWRIGSWNAGWWFVTIALASEAGLLLIAAQAGFVDGPRVMANMAVDSWLPHRFAALSQQGPHVVTYRWVRDSLGPCGTA